MRQYFQPTPEQIAKVEGWLYDGMSLTQIGNRLGVSRNVVSGVIWRRPPLRAIQKQRFDGVSVHWQHNSEKMVTKCLEQPVPDMDDEPKPEVPAATEKAGVPLKDLGLNMCKYPLVWDREVVGKWLFCGCRTRPDQIYCSKHQKKISQAQPAPTRGGTTR